MQPRQLRVGAAAGADPTWAAPIAGTRSALPRPLAGWQASAEGRGASIALTLSARSYALPSDAAPLGFSLGLGLALAR